MAEREVGFKINLNPGVAALKAQMQGVISLSKNTSLQLQQIEEQHQLRMKALSEKEKLAYVNVSKGRVTEYRSALRAIEQEEERHSLRMRQAAERDILRQKQQQIPNMLRAASQGAFFAGQSNMGRGLRVGAELAEGTEGIAAMAAVALPAAIALGGLMVATKLVEVGFGALQKTSMELVGAIAEIGGAKGIQQMFVESVSNEKLARQAAFAVAPGQRLSSNELMSRSGALAEDIQAGAFSREDYLKAYKKIGIETGTQAGVSHDMMSFLGRLALVGGTDLSETSSVYSKIVKQNRNLSPNEIKAMLITGHAIGQTGSFNIEELARAPRLTALESRLAGSDVNKLTSLMTVGTLIKEGGGDSLSQSGSWLRTLMQKATMAPELFQFKGGLISNFPEAIKQLVTMNPNLINSHLRKGLSGSAITALRSAVSERARVRPEDISEEANKARAEEIDQILKTRGSLEALDKEYQQSLSPQEHFRVAFNKISDNLEGKFYEVLVRLEPVIEEFANKIVAKKDQIGDYFQKLALWLAMGVEELPLFLDAIQMLAEFVGKMVIWASHKFLGTPETAKEANSAIDEAKEKRDKAIKTLLDVEDKKNKGIVPESTVEQARKDLEDANKKLEDANKNAKMFEIFEKLSPDVQARTKKHFEEAEKKELERIKIEQDNKIVKTIDKSHKEAMDKVDTTNDLLKTIAGRSNSTSIPPHAPIMSPDGFYDAIGKTGGW